MVMRCDDPPACVRAFGVGRRIMGFGVSIVVME